MRFILYFCHDLSPQPVDVVKQVIPKAQLKPDLLRMKASQLIIDAAEIIMEESGK
jgi:trigger factor